MPATTRAWCPTPLLLRIDWGGALAGSRRASPTQHSLPARRAWGLTMWKSLSRYVKILTIICSSVSLISELLAWVQLWMMPFMSRYRLSAGQRRCGRQVQRNREQGEKEEAALCCVVVR